jgi:hypothetical protein
VKFCYYVDKERLGARADVRVEFDIAICNALGIDVAKTELLELYGILVKEMIITRGLTRD